MRQRASPEFIRPRNLRADGVHYQESAGIEPAVVLEVARLTGAAFTDSEEREAEMEISGVEMAEPATCTRTYTRMGTEAEGAFTSGGGDATIAPITELDNGTPTSPEVAEQSEGNDTSKPDEQGVERLDEAKGVEVLGAPPATQDVATSRTICLRSLRGTDTVVPPSSTPSVASLGALGRNPSAVAATAVVGGWGEQTNASLGLISSPVFVSAGGGENISCGVPMAANKVVDLRGVKKVRPGPLARSKVDEDSTLIESEGSEESDSGLGPVKVDISAGKRMIEFQLKKNAAEERREAARVSMEKERACAAAEEETQRTLAKINARIEAQRRGPVSAWRNGNQAEYDGRSESCDPEGVDRITEDNLRELSSKHGLVVKFVDDGDASGVAQVRALARAHGIRIKILGGNGDGSEDGAGDGDAKNKMDGGPRPATPATLATSNDVTTPPPVLSSLNVKPKVAAVAGAKVVSEKTAVAPTHDGTSRESGVFSGPARMMRRALEASGGCVPSSKDVTSPRVIGASSLRKAAPTSTAPAPSASDADSGRVGDDKGSVAKGGVSAATAGRKRRKPTDNCVQIEEGVGDLCDGGNNIVETKAMPVAKGAPKRMRCANPDAGVASQPDSPAVVSTRSSRRSSSGSGSWTPGNNNLFKGAMAGIIGRGKPGRGKRP